VRKSRYLLFSRVQHLDGPARGTNVCRSALTRSPVGVASRTGLIAGALMATALAIWTLASTVGATAAATATSAKPVAAAHISETCVASSGFLASVRGRSISSVTFALDGRTLKTLNRPTSHGAFAFRVKVGAGSRHHLTVRVVFVPSSKAHPAAFRRPLARCAYHHPHHENPPARPKRHHHPPVRPKHHHHPPPRPAFTG